MICSTLVEWSFEPCDHLVLRHLNSSLEERELLPPGFGIYQEEGYAASPEDWLIQP